MGSRRPCRTPRTARILRQFPSYNLPRPVPRLRPIGKCTRDGPSRSGLAGGTPANIATAAKLTPERFGNVTF